jgi:hypothetical protein
MSRIRADQLINRAGSGGPKFPNGVAEGFSVSGIVTATSYRGDGSQLTGIDASSLKDGSNVKVQAVSGGASVTGNVAATGNVSAVDGTFSGNLTVNGTTTTIDTAVTAVDSLAVDGSVGIGTANPQVQLHLAAADPYIRLQDTAAPTGYSQIMGTHQGAIAFSADTSNSVADSHLRFDVDGSERLRITSDGSLGINEATPDSKLDIVHSTATNTATENLIHLRTDPAGAYASRGLFVKVGRDGNYDNSAVHYDVVGSAGNAGFHAFEVNGSEKLRITYGGDVQVKTGNLVIGTSGKGIDFSATSNASGMTNELLDDYEEGNGTPTVSFETSGTATLAGGATFKYVKIGDLVTFSFEFNISAVSNPAGGVKINLPFTSGGGIYSAGAVRLYNVTFTGSPFLQVGPSSSYVVVLGSVSGGATSHINSTGYYFGCISYRTTS